MNTVARVIRVREAIEDGDLREALALLGDLERELRSDPRKFACEGCGIRFRWPGELDHHERVSTCEPRGAA